MKKEDIAHMIEVKHRIRSYSMKVDLSTDEFLVGIFVKAKDYGELKQKNQWRFIENRKLHKWEATRDTKLTEVIDGEYIDSIVIL